MLKQDLYEQVTGTEKTRTIMIFPELKNSAIIEKIRNKYDPLATLMRPHITLCYPFLSNLATADINKGLEYALKDISAFKVKLQGVSMTSNMTGHYIFLNVVYGIENIINIHNLLYADYFRTFKPEWLNTNEYVPHMTIGIVGSLEEQVQAYNDIIKKEFHFECVISKISVEIIGNNEESIIELERFLL